MDIRAPKGTKDVTPAESYKWHYIENKMREVTRDFGYKEVRTPVFEHTELFLRGVGDTTDIVQKEMYTFMDKGNRSITLKPEGTAGVVRQFIENKEFAEAQPTKMYYLYCPVFRYEKPQAGRLREHHQFGLEVFGAPDASCDAEVITVALELLNRLGIRDLALHINSIGCPECRAKYNEALKEYFRPHLAELCEDCKGRFERNPLRLLDCKVEGCKKYTKDAPVILDYLCEDCREHFEALQSYLQAAGISYEIDPGIVRGLDYYTKTVFEIISNDIGAQGTVCGGGRYNGLVEQIGGPAMPGVGFGMGMERLLLVLEGLGIEIPKPAPCDIYLCNYGKEAKAECFRLATMLRRQSIRAEMDHSSRSMKAQFKYADKLGAKFVVVIGEEELKQGVLKLRSMEDGDETILPMDALAATMRLRLVR
jgi:histidyl-tRNA synthetase